MPNEILVYRFSPPGKKRKELGADDLDMTTCDVAIVGAGPYGLSLAAHLAPLGINVRIFGGAMEFWQKNMPKGMHLKSEGFASSIYDPGATFTLETYCKGQGLPYAHLGTPVPLETFTAYGLAFQQKFVPQLEDCRVVSLIQSGHGFQLILDNGEVSNAHRVVVAVGVSHFADVPDELSGLSADLVSHSSVHSSTGRFRGQKVAVVGAGASALDLAALLHQSGASVEVFARESTIRFHDRGQVPRPLMQRLRHPTTGLGPSWRSLFYTTAPQLFRYLPERKRLDIVRHHLGPAPAWFVKEQVVGKVGLNVGVKVLGAAHEASRVNLQLQDRDGRARTVTVDHVIAATGYKTRIDRLSFLSSEIQSSLRTVGHAPALSPNFESSIPGLCFIGASAANTFGPLMRFAFGARFAAERLSKYLVENLSVGAKLSSRQEKRTASVEDDMTHEPASGRSVAAKETVGGRVG